MSAMGERAEARVETSPPVRLAKGEIPTTWSRPAEQVSQLPIRAPRPLTSGIIVVSGAVVGFCLAVWLAPTRRAPAQPPEAKPAVVVASPIEAPPAVASSAMAPPVVAPPADPKPVAAIPVPPPTSSTSPGDVAPEDQGGAERAAPPAPVASEDAAETPARAKARKETDRAKALFQSGELIGAEAPLIRATLGDPSYAEGWRMLGAVRDALGNVDGARRAYRKFLQLEPTAPAAREVRAALAALAAAPKPADAAAPTPPSP